MTQRYMLTVQATPDVANIRTASLHGEEYTVVPCVALKEGVLWPANAPAPELALAEEFGRFPAGWDGRPVVYDHPKVNGEAVPASTPSILEDAGIGQLFNTKLDGKLLKTEIWVNNVRVESMDEVIQDAVQKLKDGDKIVEVSTGLFSMSEIASGEYDGEEFQAIWRNIIPDHLAILPEGIRGACSVADGCGAPRNNAMKPVMRAARMNPHDEAEDTVTDDTDEPKKGMFQKIMEAAGDLLPFVRNSETLSDQDTRTAIQGALSDLEDFFWVMAVFEAGDGKGFVVYEEFDSGKLFERTFEIASDGQVTIGADKTEVRPVTQFVPVTSGDPGNQPSAEQRNNSQETTTMDKEKFVTDLIANEGTQFTDDDKDWLMALEEAQLTKLSPEDEADDTETPAGGAAAADADDDEVLPVAASANMSTEDYIANAPPEIQAVLNASVKTHQARKVALVDTLVGNTRCRFTKEQLNAKDVDELEQMAVLAGVESDFTGAAPISVSSEHDDAPPPPPTIFQRKSEAA